MQSICSFASFTASCSCGISVCNVDRGKKQACRVARDRCSHANLTLHAEFQSGSRDIDNPPFFASRSEKNIGRSPVLKRAGFLSIKHYLRATCRSVSIAESDSANSPHLRVMVSVAEVSMEVVCRGLRLTRIRAADLASGSSAFQITA